MDETDTEIKIEDDIDPLFPNEFDFDGMINNEIQNEYKQCTTSDTGAVEAEIKQEDSIDDPLSIIDTVSNGSNNVHKNVDVKTEHIEIKQEIT